MGDKDGGRGRVGGDGETDVVVGWEIELEELVEELVGEWDEVVGGGSAEELRGSSVEELAEELEVFDEVVKSEPLPGSELSEVVVESPWEVVLDVLLGGASKEVSEDVDESVIAICDIICHSGTWIK